MPTLFPHHACLRLTTRQSEPSIAGMVRSGKDAFQPRPEDHFTFGLWTVGNPGRDPFGDPVRPPLTPAAIVRKLAALGAYGVNLHDNDLVPAGSSAAERDRIVREFKQVLGDTGMKVPMATTNLFSDPAFRDGAFTSSDSRVRAYALQKTLAAIDLAVELGATTYVCWGGREGVETNAAKDPRTALAWDRDDPKGAFFLVKLLEDSKWPGMRHFDSHAYRTEDEAGVWDFAAGSMRTYLILKDKVVRFNADPEIQQLLTNLDGGKSSARVPFEELRNTKFDLAALRSRGYAYERLDQLTMELLLGVR